jgi:hypothetical protein
MDMLAAEGRAFVAGFDNLGLASRSSFADLPPEAQVRALVPAAQFLQVQLSNPGLDLTLPQLLLIDLASAFLRWIEHPHNRACWDDMFAARVEVDPPPPWVDEADRGDG